MILSNRELGEHEFDESSSSSVVNINLMWILFSKPNACEVLTHNQFMVLSTFQNLCYVNFIVASLFSELLKTLRLWV